MITRFLAKGGERVEGGIIALAVALLVYLPLEGILLGGLSGAAYWTLRLLPDALIALAAAAVLLVGGARRREAVVILSVLAIVSGCVIALDAFRGFAPSTTINALRVLLRYAVLGATLFAVVRQPSRLLRWLAWVLAIGAMFQFVVALTQFGMLLWPMATGTRTLSLPALVGVAGTLGRYDRLGFFMVAAVLLALAGGVPGPRALGRIVLWGGIVGLALSSSRQALIGLAVAAALLAVLPRLAMPMRISRAAIATMAILLALFMPMPTVQLQVADADSPGGLSAVSTPSSGDQPPARASTQLSLNPNNNFRLYYNLKLLPWAAIHEPLLGFGPGEQVSPTANLQLQQKMEADGMTWDYARNFTSDSEIGSLVVQFGIILPSLFFLFVGWLAFGLLRARWRNLDDPWLSFAVAYTAACLVGAGFGPSFETRTVSVVLWLGLFCGLLLIRRPLAPES